MRELDRRLRHLARPDELRDLSGLEAEVWSKIDRRRRLVRLPRRWAAVLCAVVSVLAFSAGVAAGATAPRPEASIFAAHGAHAPSAIFR